MTERVFPRWKSFLHASYGITVAPTSCCPTSYTCWFSKTPHTHPFSPHTILGKSLSFFQEQIIDFGVIQCKAISSTIFILIFLQIVITSTMKLARLLITHILEKLIRIVICLIACILYWIITYTCFYQHFLYISRLKRTSSIY